jgi:hypothetical protein
MTTKKNTPARISRIVTMASSTDPKKAVISIELTGNHHDLVAKTLKALRSPGGKRALREFLYQQVDEHPGMERLGRIQPLIPAALNDQFKQVAKRSKVNRHALIKQELRKIFNLKTGKQKIGKAKSGGKALVEFPNMSEFCKRATPQKIEEKKVRFTFVAGSGKLKLGLEEYIEKHGITLSGFFAALIGRICDRDAQAAPERESSVVVEA